MNSIFFKSRNIFLKQGVLHRDNALVTRFRSWRPYGSNHWIVALVVALVLTACGGPTSTLLPRPTTLPPTPTLHSTVPPISGSNIKWAGVRSSQYGIHPFPTATGWTDALTTMSSYFPGSTPIGVWLAGEILFNGSNSGEGFYFPNPGGTWDKTIQFNSTDENESYLSYFDAHGIKVFLQLEPGFSPMDQLFDIMYKHYGSHPSIIGFGVDVEWYKSQCDGCTNAKITDALAQSWEAKVKSLNPNYRLFLKHYNKANLPPTYRGSIIFIDDGEQNQSYRRFLKHTEEFSNFFYPNPVMYQIGYPSDKSWWKNLASPIPQTIGKALSAQTRAGQDVGVIWVDFSLRDVLPTN